MEMNNNFYPNEYSLLLKNIVESQGLKIWIIKGEAGIGKTTLIQSIIKDSNLKSMMIKNVYEEIDALAPIQSAIYSFYQKENKKEQLTNYHVLSYPEHLKQTILKICKENNVILFFDDICNLQSKITMTFILDLISTIITFKEKYNVVIFLEASDDSIDSIQKNFLYDLSSLLNYNQIIRLKKPDKFILQSYVYYLLNNRSCISNHTINRIIQSGFENLQFIKRIIECLKDIGTLYLKEGIWYCDSIDTEVLYDYLKDSIGIRYNKLENNLQKVFLQASVTGFEIDIKLLSNPIGVLKVENKLNRIENISKLVKKDKLTYSFESDEVYYFANNEIDDTHKSALNKLIANYLENQLPSIDFNVKRIVLRKKYYKIAKYYENSNNMNKAFDYYTKYAILSYNLKDYLSVVSCYKIALELINIKAIDPVIQQFWLFLVANSNQQCGNFKEASYLWKKLINWKSNSILYDSHLFHFKYGYCLRRSGKVFDAYMVLESLQEILKNEKTEILADVLIVLIGITDQLGKKEDKEIYYNWALDLCQNFNDKSKYYKLLGKSNMIYAAKVAIPEMKKAFEFFANSEDEMEAGKIAHNIGVSSIQDNKLCNAKEYLQIATEIFTKYSSRNISYVYCAFGIAFALQNDYDSARNEFKKVIEFSTNSFAIITAKLNLFYCFHKLKQPQLAENILIECEDNLRKNGSDKLVLQRNLYFAKAMHCYINGNIDECYKLICHAYYIEVDKLGYRTYNVYLAKWIRKLSKELNRNISSEIVSLAQQNLPTYKELCYNQQVMLGTLLFW